MGSGDCFQFGVRVKLFNHGAHVATDRRVANPELEPNLPIAETRGEEFQHLLFTAREAAEEHSTLRTSHFLAMAAVGEREDIRHCLKELHVVAREVTSG